MGTINRQEDIRVEVFPDEPLMRSSFTEDELEKHRRDGAEAILKEVKRHIDCGGAAIAFRTETTCEFCGLIWEVEDDGTPVCCLKAVDEFDQQQTLAADERRERGE